MIVQSHDLLDITEWFNDANLLYKLDDYNDTIEASDKALTIYPNFMMEAFRAMRSGRGAAKPKSADGVVY